MLFDKWVTCWTKNIHSFVCSSNSKHGKILRNIFMFLQTQSKTQIGLLCNQRLYVRAQPDIMSGPEGRQIFKCPDSGLPVFFLPGLRTLKSRNKIKKNVFCSFFCLSLWWKIWNYKSGFSPVRQDLSGKFECPVLSGQETHMPSPVEPKKRHYGQKIGDKSCLSGLSDFGSFLAV